MKITASIIIPVYNNYFYTEKCIKAVLENSGDEIDYEIIVVDNDSTDQTSFEINKMQGEIRSLNYFKLDSNYGFGYACNYGAEKARGKYLVFLNNDTEPLKDWLFNAINSFKLSNRIGIVGSKLLYPDYTIQHCGIQFFKDVNPHFKFWPLHRFMGKPADYPQANKPEIVRAVTGACLFIAKELFNEVGGFDLTYKMYFEDTDLNFKVKARGYNSFYQPASVVIHHEGKSSANQEVVDILNAESAKVFYEKWKKEINIIEEIEEYILEYDENITILSDNIYPKNLITYPENGPAVIDLELFKKFILRFLILGKAYYHFGGAGDALLLLSTFYDENPNQIIISFTNSTAALKSFFKSFRDLKHVYMVKIPDDPFIHSNLRKLLPEFNNFLGMGVTPSKPYEFEWFHGLDIFTKYGIKKHPEWINIFRNRERNNYDVIIAPRGSVLGMYKSKKNIIDPSIWSDLINYLNRKGIVPAVIGTPDEDEFYPLIGKTINKRSYSFSDQMSHIAKSKILIGADSWAKTFSALAGIATIVFEPIKGKDLDGWKDSSDYVFIEPWNEIKVVKNFDEFKNIFSELYQESESAVESQSKTDVDNDEPKVSSIAIDSNYQLIWNSPIYDNSGYADESRNFVLGLHEEGVDLKLNPITWSNSEAQLPVQTLKLFDSLCSVKLNENKEKINVSHLFAPFFIKRKDSYNIGRTMYETDTIPNDWIIKCNEMDEVWVPSEFNINSFEKAGVNKNKLFKIPEAIDTDLFNPKGEVIEEISSIKGFKFLSVFDWTLRKGWDVLIKVFTELYGDNPDVKLILKVWSSYGKSINEIKNDIETFLNKNNLSEDIPKNIIFFSKTIPVEEMPALYRSVNAYVSPNRGEGWGRPLIESMASGIPVITTRCTGQLEFMNNNNSFLINNKKVLVPEEAVKELNILKGHSWFEPSAEHLKKLMKTVYENPNLVQAKVQQGIEDIQTKFNRKSVAKLIKQRLDKISRHLAVRDVKILWNGNFDYNSSLGIVNNHMSASLKNLGVNVNTPLDKSNSNVELKSEAHLDEQKVINVRHSWPPDLTPPSKGYWVVIQPWEFGSLPEKWIETFEYEVDEIWVPSNYVKECFIESGVNSDKVKVIPNGFDPNIFNKHAKPFTLKTKKKFKFLYVGGTIYRKGIDILIETYLKTFNNDDDVCLVIKDMGGDSFYNGRNINRDKLDLLRNKNYPEIEYVDKFLTPNELAGTYRSCDVLVHPYRGEGFGLPILESMACGTPVIVTNGGACLDFCNSQNSFLTKAEKIILNKKMVGDLATVDFPWLLETNKNELAINMKQVFDNQSSLKAKSHFAYESVHENFTWNNSGMKIFERILELKEKNIIRYHNNLKPKSAITSILDQANKLLVDEDYENALITLDKLLTHHEDYNFKDSKIGLDKLFQLAGKIANAAGDLQKSNSYFEKLLELNPNSSEACAGLGENLYMLGNLEASKTMLEWAINFDSNNELLLQKLAIVNEELNLDSADNSLLKEQEQL
ncbi:MAG: glycosyltransferase [Melioribacteraceae bacterium]|nr:glycosyltransferase [Melioribacteraceae bacterium]MCF8353758.1 glycosyltransferase [Melioribacteraceae bacterium]MCF8392433.1 glycosyltransferase [Melioribacteraceae bacterium]MCF8418344.1 glycosyltransferase [Melioribacteraceae bacterium]